MFVHSHGSHMSGALNLHYLAKVDIRSLKHFVLLDYLRREMRANVDSPESNANASDWVLSIHSWYTLYIIHTYVVQWVRWRWPDCTREQISHFPRPGLDPWISWCQNLPLLRPGSITASFLLRNPLHFYTAAKLNGKNCTLSNSLTSANMPTTLILERIQRSGGR